jgi:hypothetical protein
MKLLYLCVLLLATQALSAEELYRWVDEDGNMQYTQTPPPAGVKSEVKDIKDVNSAAAEGLSQPKPEEPSEAGMDSMTENDADKMLAEKTANCQKSMQDLAVLESKSEVVMLDSAHPGKAAPIDETARKQRIATEKAYIKTYCDGVKPTAPKPEAAPKPEVKK